MELIESLLPIFRMYQICGFTPFSVPFDGKKELPTTGQLKWIIYSGSVIACLTAMILYNLIEFRYFMGGERSEMLNYLSSIIVTVMRLVSLAITIESVLNRKQQFQFLVQFDKIGHHFRNELETDFDYKKIRKNTFAWTGIWFVQMGILFSLVVLEISKLDGGIWSNLLWLLCTLPILASSIRYIQIIHYIRLLGYCFEMINDRLEYIHSTIFIRKIRKKQTLKEFTKISFHYVEFITFCGKALVSLMKHSNGLCCY